jgi:hypothetical protein
VNKKNILRRAMQKAARVFQKQKLNSTNTIMTKKILQTFVTGAVCALAVTAALAQSASPFYKTLSDGGNAASPSETDFIAQPALQLRLISINYGSDTNNAQLQVSTGIGAYAITATNAASSSTTNQVNSTNGLANGSVLLLQHGGAAYIATLSSYGNTGTNTLNGGTTTNVNFVVLGAGGFGVATSVGDVVYPLGTPATTPIGTGTNWLNGEAIFTGNVGKPVRVVLTPTLTTNNLYSVTGHYE